jgi:hypothetical protein
MHQASTIAEIEAAIELLSPQQVEELAIWLDSLRARREKPVSADAWLSRARGAARSGVTSAEVLALTRYLTSTSVPTPKSRD